MALKAGTLEIPELIQFLRKELHELPHERKPGNNTKYQVEDAVMAAFSVFFTQSASFLEHQRVMKKSKGKDNAGSLFYIKEIPCDNQIRKLLESISVLLSRSTFLNHTHNKQNPQSAYHLRVFT